MINNNYQTTREKKDDPILIISSLIYKAIQNKRASNQEKECA